MTFTQFVYPHGRRRTERIAMPHEIDALAADLAAAGWRFEIEMHPATRIVHMDCCDDEAPLAMGTVANGPGVPAAVQRLVRAAHAVWIGRGRPTAA